MRDSMHIDAPSFTLHDELCPVALKHGGLRVRCDCVRADCGFFGDQVWKALAEGLTHTQTRKGIQFKSAQALMVMRDCQHVVMT